MNGDGTMYQGPVGHAVHYVEDDPTAETGGCNVLLTTPSYDESGGSSGAFAYFGCWLSARFLHDAHEPDHLNKRQALYREYGLGLYDIMCQKLASAPRRLDRDKLGPKLDEVSKLADEKAQIARLREIAAKDVGVAMDGYDPVAEGAQGTLTWPQYQMNHQQGGSAARRRAAEGPGPRRPVDEPQALSRTRAAGAGFRPAVAPGTLSGGRTGPPTPPRG